MNTLPVYLCNTALPRIFRIFSLFYLAVLPLCSPLDIISRTGHTVAYTPRVTSKLGSPIPSDRGCSTAWPPRATNTPDQLVAHTEAPEDPILNRVDLPRRTAFGRLGKSITPEVPVVVFEESRRTVFALS
jgi:hypothetical protein